MTTGEAGSDVMGDAERPPPAARSEGPAGGDSGIAGDSIEAPRDRAGREYWNEVWRARRIQEPIDPTAGGFRMYVERRFDRLFRRLFEDGPVVGDRLLEIGCGDSRWLPHFAREFGFEVAGLDYSRPGCEAAARRLEDAGVEGHIFHGDVFDPPARLVRWADVGVSFGVVEHFDEPAECIRAAARLVRPGGMLITVIPNLTGVYGTLQRLLDRGVYEAHRPLDRSALAGAHADAGLQVERCEYFMLANLYILNLGRRGNRPIGRLFGYLCGALNRLAWSVERGVAERWTPPRTSPYVVCVARTPGEG